MGEETVTVFTWNHLNGRRRIPHIVGSNCSINQLLVGITSWYRTPAEPDLNIIDMVRLLRLRPTTEYRTREVGSKVVIQQKETIGQLKSPANLVITALCSPYSIVPSCLINHLLIGHLRICWIGVITAIIRCARSTIECSLHTRPQLNRLATLKKLILQSLSDPSSVRLCVVTNCVEKWVACLKLKPLLLIFLLERLVITGHFLQIVIIEDSGHCTLPFISA
jgi:hypothetical protein